MLKKKRILLVAGVVCLLAAASIATAAQAVTANVYTLPIVGPDNYFPGHLSADSSGKIWAGPVYSPSSVPELLAVDPASNQLTVWTHQNTGVFARSQGFEATAVDAQGRVWFNGGLANSSALVSRLDPGTGVVTGWPASPSDFDPDPQGRLWLALGGSVGRLDPATNVVTTWLGVPQGVASDAQSRGWFVARTAGCYISDSLAVVDPVANTITTWTLPVPSAPQFSNSFARPAGPRAITVDDAGKIWAVVNYFVNTGYDCYYTGLVGSAVVVLDSATNVMKLWPCPSGCDRFTTISVDPLGKAWLTDTGNGTPSDAKIDRLDLNSNPVSFVEYDAGTLTGCSLPYPVGTVADLQGNGWSSYAGNINYGCTSSDKISQLPP